jgi:choline dehydrogenase-like flavoprotein
MIANTQTDVERETGKEGSDGLYCTVGLAWEQVPNPKSKVTLDSSATDRFGQSQLLCDWNLTDTDRTTAVEAMKCLIRQVTGRLRKNNPDVYFMDFTQSEWPDDGPYKGPQPSHEMGTTRMSEPGGDGVVNSDCQMHDFDNVYIAGSSVFTRVGWANPTLTIIALAIRLGEHLTNPKPPIYK